MNYSDELFKRIISMNDFWRYMRFEFRRWNQCNNAENNNKKNSIMKTAKEIISMYEEAKETGILSNKTPFSIFESNFVSNYSLKMKEEKAKLIGNWFSCVDGNFSWLWNYREKVAILSFHSYLGDAYYLHFIL